MNCPVCKATLEISLSPEEELLYDCPFCHSSLFFEKGEVQILKESTSSPETKEEVESQVSADAEGVEPLQEEPPEVPTLDFSGEEELGKEGEEEESVNLKEQTSPHQQKEVFSKEESVQEDVLGTEAEEELTEDASSNELRSEEESSFFYSLSIENIHSVDLKKEVELALEDENLKLTTEGRSLSIKDGRLYLKHLSPVKTHIIVRSLIGLPLKISWEQYLLSDLDK